MVQESLLPGTDAIPKGEICCQRFRGGWLVRYKNLNGYTLQFKCEDPEVASTLTIGFITQLRGDLERMKQARKVDAKQGEQVRDE
jgi:hypothetical protein